MAETVEDIDSQIAALREQKRAARLIEHQRVVLLPQLVRKRNRLEALHKRSGVELDEVDAALADVDAGRITTYLVRKPPVRKAKAPKAEGTQSQSRDLA